MRGKILKRAIAAALVLTFVSGGTAIPQISQVFGSTVLTANAEGYELPFVPAHTGYYHFTVTNNTDYVTVTWNGQAVTNGMDLTDAHSVIMTADNPFIWTVGNSVNTATKNSSGQYRVSLSTTSDVTIDAYTPSIAHDNGYARETTIYLKPENFTQGDYFYYDKSIPAGTLRASVSEGTVSFSTIMDTPVAMYDELGNTITLTQEGSVYSFEPVDGTVYYLVRTHIAGTESNWDGNETPMMPVGSVTTSVVKHDNGAGSEEDVELTSANFDYVSKMFSTDKSFADGEIINLLRDPSSATGLIMVQPGISVSVYTAINGNTVQLTKLANSDNTSDNYTFPIMEAQSYYVVKNYVAAGFTVTWLNEDGTELEKDTGVEEGTMPSYDGEEPTKEETEFYTYTFIGWDQELSAVTGDVTYTAVFKAVPKYLGGLTVCNSTDTYYNLPYKCDYNHKYTGSEQIYPSSMLTGLTGKDLYSMTFYSSDDITVTAKGLQVFLAEVDDTTFSAWKDIPENAVKVFESDYTFGSGANVIRFDTPYTYNGGNLMVIVQNSEDGEWNDNVKRFYAEYQNGQVSWCKYNTDNGYGSNYLSKCTFGFVDENKYTVTWKDAEGNVLETDTDVYPGTMPSFDGTVPAAPENYHFKGWSPAVSAVTGDATYTAVYEHDPFTVTFDEANGKITTQTVAVNDRPRLYTPAKEGYAFIGWYDQNGALYGGNPVTSDLTLTAHWVDASLAKGLEVGAIFYPGDLVNFGDSYYNYDDEDGGVDPDTFDGYAVIGRIRYDSDYGQYGVCSQGGSWIAYVTSEKYADDEQIGLKVTGGSGTYDDPFLFEIVEYTQDTTHTVIWVGADGETVLETDTDVPWGTYPSFDGEITVPEGKILYWTDGRKSYATNYLPKVKGDVTFTAQFTEMKTLAVGTLIYEGDTVDFGDYYFVYDNYEEDDPVIRQGDGGITISTFDFDQEGYYANGNYSSDYDLYVRSDSDIGAVAIMVSGGTGTEDAPFTFELVKLYSVGLPENMELCEGYSLTNGYAVIGSEIKFRAKEHYTASNVTANGTELVAEDGVYTVTVTDDLLVEADVELQTFTVTWQNEDGTVLETDEDVAYGTMPCYDGEEPKKAADAQFIYTFKDWDPELTEVTGDAVYTAVFEQEAIEPLADHSDITAEEVAVNEALTVQCQAEGGVGEYEYSVYVKRAEETSWTTKQSKGTNPNVVVSFAETGMHDICVKIKDSSGMIVKKYFKVNVVDGTFANTSGISAEQAATHETITVYCSAQGGSGAYTYSVYTKRADETSWTTRQSKGTNTDVDVSFAETGLHDICVKTVDYSGMVVKKYFRVNITAGEFANTTTLSVRKAAAGEAITVNCSAQGGSGTYKYSVYTKGTNDTAWKTKQNYKTNEVVSLTFDDPGVYQVCVKVKDDTNTVVKSYFTVRITENT